MACEHVTIDDGKGGRISAIVCGPKRKCRCGRKATLECDWKVPSRKSGTCDKPLCPRCSFSPAPGKDLCLSHRAALDEWRGKR